MVNTPKATDQSTKNFSNPWSFEAVDYAHRKTKTWSTGKSVKPSTTYAQEASSKPKQVELKKVSSVAAQSNLNNLATSAASKKIAQPSPLPCVQPSNPTQTPDSTTKVMRGILQLAPLPRHHSSSSVQTDAEKAAAFREIQKRYLPKHLAHESSFQSRKNIKTQQIQKKMPKGPETVPDSWEDLCDEIPPENTNSTEKGNPVTNIDLPKALKNARISEKEPPRWESKNPFESLVEPDSPTL